MTDSNTVKAEEAKAPQVNPLQVVLYYPLRTPSGTVTTVTLRRGQSRDMLAAQRNEPNDPARRELVLISMLAAENLTIEDLEELDFADLAAVQQVFQGLFVRGN
jgi:Phage tail assembly chaperone proteins, E, or 41 or 14